jgi:hypothetical protein
MCGVNSAIKFWRRAMALIVVLSGLLWLGALLYLIPSAAAFQEFRLPADEISQIRIDVYKEPLGEGESQPIKTVAITDPAQIAQIIRFLGQSTKYKWNHEHFVGRAYYLRFWNVHTADWRRERVSLHPTTDRGHGARKVGVIALWRGPSDREPAVGFGRDLANVELSDLIEALAGDKNAERKVGADPRLESP